MKKLYFFPFAIAAALMLSACSDDVSDANPTPVSSGYVSFNINLPTTSGNGTRAYQNNNHFNDGQPVEYQAQGGKLLVFSGNTEADATFLKSFTLQGFDWKDNADDQITKTTLKAIASVHGLSGTKFWALIVLNDNGLIPELSENSKLSNLTTGALTDISAEKLTQTSTGALTTENASFLMSNAPLSTKQGGSQNPTGTTIKTLVEFSPDKIKETESEAEADPVGDINVERAVAKVTLSKASETVGDVTTKIASYTLQGWTLDNTNKKTYLVRNVGFTTAPWSYKNTTTNTTGYRFVENDVLDNQALYRTYFAIDPNYNTDSKDGDFAVKTGTLAAADLKDPGESLYCPENTFDVDRMKWRNTTRAIVKAKLTMVSNSSSNINVDTDGSFFVINGDKNYVYTTDGAAKVVAGKLIGSTSNPTTWSSTYIASGSLSADNIKVGLNTANGGGYVKVTSVTLPDNGVTYASGETKASAEAAAVEFLNGLITSKSLKVAYYAQGESYYQIRIKHFGDEETPWSITEPGEAYPGTNKENNWLGRYGVLRNTWYQIEVTGLKEIGDPEIPSISLDPEDPDDPGDEWDDEIPDQYLAVKINILNWAVRKQSATLE